MGLHNSFLRFVFILVLLIPLSLSARNDSKIEIKIQPVDSITRFRVAQPLPEALAFQQGDSVDVAEYSFAEEWVNGTEFDPFYIVVKVPRVATEYRILIDAEGYCTRTVHVKIGPKDHKTINLGEIGLQRLPVKLNEVAVTASKIKMYYRGDTLVYNADAFLLPDGSMLDDLLRKLDGVTIDRSGQIYCNGRRVETLLLEGRNLFDGNPRTLLDNLGAYTVNKIKVFEHTDEHESLVGYSSKKEKPLAMDVVLKKQYSIGKWVNVDAGYGTHNRYLARGFGLGFSRTLALSAFVNINNLSTESNPGRDDFWDPEKARMRDSSFLNGGLSYQYDSNNRKIKIHGGVTAGSDEDIYERGLEQVTYLPDGDRFRTNYSWGDDRKFYLTTNHTMYMRLADATLEVTPAFRYYTGTRQSRNVNATFSEDLGHLDSEQIENLYQPGSEEMVRDLINRMIQRKESQNDRLYGSLRAQSTVRLPNRDHFMHNLSFEVNGDYNYMKGEDFDRYTLNYGADATPASDVYAYRRNDPQSMMALSAKGKYEMNINSRHTLSAGYSFSYNRDSDTFDRYLLNHLDQTSPEGLKFGSLPAGADLSGVLDADNSRHTFQQTDEHKLELTGSFEWGEEDIDSDGAYGELRLFVNPQLRIVDRRLDFSRPTGYDTTAVSAPLLPQFSCSLNYSAKKENKGYYYDASLEWRSTPELFDMTSLINTLDNTNPLLVFQGNPDLRYGYNHHASVAFGFSKRKGGYHRHRIKLDYEFYDNKLQRTSIYDPSTGVTFIGMGNVDGSRSLWATYSGSGTIVRWRNRRELTYNVDIDAGHGREASLVAFGDASDVNLHQGRRSIVSSNNIEPKASLSFRFGRLDQVLTFTWSGRYSHYWSNDPDFASSSYAWEYYSLNGMFTLPYNFKISSQITLKTRSGFDNAALDTDNLIWNLSGSWHWKKAHLTFLVDCYDLLNQNSNVSSSVDALGRSESWMNTLPSYVLFRVRYHIDLSPGR